MKSTFPKIKVLPDDGRPITEWKPYDRAFKNIAEGIRKEGEQLRDSTYHLKKYVRHFRVVVIPIVLSTRNLFIHLPTAIFSSFANLSNASRYPRYRRRRKIPIGLFIGLLIVAVPFFSQLSNISELLSSEISENSRSEPRPILTKTQMLKSTGWIPIGKINNTSSLSPEEPLLDPFIDPPVIPSLQSVVTVKYEIDLRKEKPTSSEILQKLQPGDQLLVYQVKQIAKPSYNSPSEVWVQVRKCNQTCQQ